MNCSQVQDAVCRYLFPPHLHVCVPNTTQVVGWEADLLVLRRSGWMEEIEVKVSVADFRREFTSKKDKHVWLVKGRPKFVYNYAYTERTYDWTQVKPLPVKRFWFAVPEEIAEKVRAELPVHAGLIVVYGRVARKVVKAPALPGRKVTEAEQIKLLHSIYARCWTYHRMQMISQEATT